MPPRFEFRLADSQDDAPLRALFASIPMEGGMEIAFAREPSFFGALDVLGTQVQVGICTDRSTGKIVGAGTRSIATCFLDGTPTPVGYLGDLRLHPAHRRGTLVARGYQFFHELDQDGAADIYFTAIFSDNTRARSSLASGRANIPTYHPLGRYLCPGLLPGRFPSQPGVSPATDDDLPKIVAFLNTHNATRQFAPVHREHDFGPGGRWSGIRASDFFLLRRENAIVATAALWDQRPFKQTRVLGYHGRWRALRAASIAFRHLGAPNLPKPGSTLPFGYASFLAAKHPNDLAAVLRASLSEAKNRRWLYCLAGLHADDPLARALDTFRKVDFTGHLYAVSPRQMDRQSYPLDDRIPYVEAAAL